MSVDLAVWELRRYCSKLDYCIRSGAGKVDMLPHELGRIERSEDQPPHKFSLQNGELEKILTNRKHPARSALVWNNFRFGARSRKQLSMPVMQQFKNSPLLLHPEMLYELKKYIVMPNEVFTAYEPQARKALAERGK